MTKAHQLIADAITIADGEIVGRVRLQKVFYLLEQMGLQSGFGFAYHHYGPYSRDLDEALDAAKAFSSVKEITQNRRSDGAHFSKFVVDIKTSEREIRTLGQIPSYEAKSKIDIMKDVSSTVIELAATIHWLVQTEKIADWRPELKKRKGVKTEGGRTDQALMLLKRLGIPNVSHT